MMQKDMSLTLEEEEELKPLRDADLGLLKLASPDLGLLKLASPDLGLLKLASPDLERLIIQSSGMEAPAAPHFVFPKPAADEQEFAEGFVKALEDLHKQNQLSGGPGGPGGPGTGPQPELPVYTTLSPYGGSFSTEPFAPVPLSPVPLSPLKEEPQTVPDVFGDSPPLSPADPADPADPTDPTDPVDPDSQERIKAERKRLRNRIAASKCRRRKLERISRLEDKVKSLKTQNTDLASTASALRDQVQRLKQKVLAHVSSGCEVQVH